MTMTREARLGEAVADLAAVLVSDFDLAGLLHRLADSCIAVCGAQGAGIVAADENGTLQDVVYSSEAVRRLERFQLRFEQGPCVECYHTGKVVEEPDLASASGRWPKFAPEALRLGIGAASALPLRLRGHTVGALNLFHTAPSSNSPSAVRSAQTLADLAMLGIVQHSHGSSQVSSAHSHISTALQERSLIERAKGFLAEHGEITIDEASELLRSYASREGVGLTRVARDLTSRALSPDLVLAALHSQ